MTSHWMSSRHSQEISGVRLLPHLPSSTRTIPGEKRQRISIVKQQNLHDSQLKKKNIVCFALRRQTEGCAAWRDQCGENECSWRLFWRLKYTAMCVGGTKSAQAISISCRQSFIFASLSLSLFPSADPSRPLSLCLIPVWNLSFCHAWPLLLWEDADWSSPSEGFQTNAQVLFFFFLRITTETCK